MAISLLSSTFTLAAQPMVKKPEPALDFQLPDLKQNTVSLKDYKDKQLVILFFWTTKCPFCRVDLRKMNDIYPTLKKEGWELLAIDVGETQSEVDNFVKAHNLAFKILLDKDTQVAVDYGILGVPTFIIIDKKGNTVFKDHYFPYKEYKNLLIK